MMKRENLTSLLKKADKEELISLIERMADADSASEHVLLEYCKGKASPKDKKLLHDRQLEMKWDSIREIVDTANEYGGCSDDDEDDVYDALYEMQELVKKDSTSWDVRKDILDEILEQAGYGNSGFDDILYETAMKFCQEKEEKHYLAEYLTQHGGYYWSDRGADILQEIGTEEEYLSFRMQHLESERDYMDLAEYYDKKEEHTKAVEIMETALVKCDVGEWTYSYLFREYEMKGDHEAIWNLYRTAEKKDRKYHFGVLTEMMYEYSKQRGEYENQRQMLTDMVSYCSEREVGKWYDLCEKEMKEADFRKLEEELQKTVKKRNITAYLDICMRKGRMKEVLDYILQARGFGSWSNADSGHKYSKQLEKTYPREILEYYWKETEYYTCGGKRETYARAAGLLSDIQKLMAQNGWKAEWEKCYADYLERHKRKRLLMEAIANCLRKQDCTI